MTNLARLRRTLDLASDLGSIVGTMKTLAAVNIRQFEVAASAIDAYVDTIELALHVALREVEPSEDLPVQRTGWIVIGSDQGLCGPFNERVATLAVQSMRERPGPHVIVGHRVARRLDGEGIAVQHEFRTPGSVAGVTDLVADILSVLGDWQDAGEIDALRVLYNVPRTGGGFDTTHTRLLPLDDEWLAELRERPWQSRSRPIQPHDPQLLFRWLIREWLFARIYLACAASLAAENAARLLATQAAQRSLDERVDRLRVRYRNERQQAITEELLDLYR